MNGAFFYTIDQNEEVIIERFGKYLRTEKAPGLHMKMPPPLENIAARISTQLTQDGDKLATKTKDDIFVEIPITMHFQVVDSKKFYYDSPNPVEQMKIRVNATIKQLAAAMNFIELYETREILSQQAVEKVGKELEELYGIKLKDVIVDQPTTTAEAMRSFSGVKESERNRQTAINNAEAKKSAAIAEAEGDKQARILRGQGAAGERAAILEGYAEQFNALAAKGVPEAMAHDMIKLAMINDTIRDAAAKGNVILTTTDSNSMLSQLQANNRMPKPSQGIKDGPGAP